MPVEPEFNTEVDTLTLIKGTDHPMSTEMDDYDFNNKNEIT